MDRFLWLPFPTSPACRTLNRWAMTHFLKFSQHRSSSSRALAGLSRWKSVPGCFREGLRPRTWPRENRVISPGVGRAKWVFKTCWRSVQWTAAISSEKFVCLRRPHVGGPLEEQRFSPVSEREDMGTFSIARGHFPDGQEGLFEGLPGGFFFFSVRSLFPRLGKGSPGHSHSRPGVPGFYDEKATVPPWPGR